MFESKARGFPVNRYHFCLLNRDPSGPQRANPWCTEGNHQIYRATDPDWLPSLGCWQPALTGYGLLPAHTAQGARAARRDPGTLRGSACTSTTKDEPKALELLPQSPEAGKGSCLELYLADSPDAPWKHLSSVCSLAMSLSLVWRVLAWFSCCDCRDAPLYGANFKTTRKHLNNSIDREMVGGCLVPTCLA